MIFLAVLLGLVAVAVGLNGASSLTQATLGVGTIASACLLAIFSRLFQASAHHKEVMAILRAARAPAAPAPVAHDAPAETPSTIQCVECKEIGPIGPEYCPNCGHRYQPDPPGEPAST